ncbi:Ail/Lom family outer membrane beta-barrel protein [Escherichia coli]|nr:Ail/Lom family outer membrane beta-barrel protein [Escherichia coli]
MTTTDWRTDGFIVGVGYKF